MLVIQIGSNFKLKGVDRTLKAIASLPDNIRQKLIYFVIGQANAISYLKMAKRLHIENNVCFHSGRDDIADIIFAADLMLHPAYSEAGGKVLLEALVAGLPVITTAICGYAPHISKANSGIVISEPFQQQHLNVALLNTLLDNNQLRQWSHNAITYANQTDLYSMSEKAVDIISDLTL